MTASDPDRDDATAREAPPTVVIRTSRGQRAVVAGLVAAVGFVIVQSVTAHYDANVATDAAQDLAGPVATLCASDPDARRRIGDARCDVASDVQRESSAGAVPRDGRDGDDGDDGRGIAATTLRDGHLVVTYTDGQQVDLGVVVGPTGATGEPGRGIVDASLDADGRLVVTYTDGVVTTVGHVVGRDGADGRGVDRVEVRDGRLLVYYSTAPDDAVDVGALPAGPAGRGIASLDLDLDRCEVTIHYTDGTDEVKPVTGCERGSTDTTTPPAVTTTATTDGGSGLLPG